MHKLFRTFCNGSNTSTRRNATYHKMHLNVQYLAECYSMHCVRNLGFVIKRRNSDFRASPFKTALLFMSMFDKDFKKIEFIILKHSILNFLTMRTNTSTLKFIHKYIDIMKQKSSKLWFSKNIPKLKHGIYVGLHLLLQKKNQKKNQKKKIGRKLWRNRTFDQKCYVFV